MNNSVLSFPVTSLNALRLLIFFFIVLYTPHSQAQTTISNYYNTPQVIYDNPQTSAPPVIYQNPLTTPPLINPSSTLPGAPTLTSFGLPGQPSSEQGVLPGNSTTPSGPSLLQQIYQQPAMPTAQYQPPAQAPILQYQPVPFEAIEPPFTYLPGLATIKDKRWMISDYLYNLAPNIGIKVEVIKPDKRYIPLSSDALERQLTSVFEQAQINTNPILTDCRPPLPMFYVLVMVYPCDRRLVGFISAQLFEVARPQRVDIDLNGVWQVVTWERQSMVSSNWEDFAHEVWAAIEDISNAFTNTYSYYHRIPERPCFPPPPNSRNEQLYKRYYDTKPNCCQSHPPLRR